MSTLPYVHCYYLYIIRSVRTKTFQFAMIRFRDLSCRMLCWYSPLHSSQGKSWNIMLLCTCWLTHNWRSEEIWQTRSEAHSPYPSSLNKFKDNRFLKLTSNFFRHEDYFNHLWKNEHGKNLHYTQHCCWRVVLLTICANFEYEILSCWYSDDIWCPTYWPSLFDDIIVWHHVEITQRGPYKDSL